MRFNFNQLLVQALVVQAVEVHLLEVELVGAEVPAEIQLTVTVSDKKWNRRKKWK
jgi:hypothetical protein